MTENKKMSLTAKVLIGMVLGILVGLVINKMMPAAQFPVINEYLVEGLFYTVGKLFVNSLKMLVVPLVLFSLISGVCGIGNIKLLGRIGGKAFIYYLATTAIAIATAITLAASFGIGKSITLDSGASFTGKESPPLSEVLIDIVPSNPIKAMADGDMLSVIFFAILVGVSLLIVGKRAKNAIEAIEVGNEVMMKMVTVVTAIAPYAVFCLIARAIANLGLDLLQELIGYVAVLVGALLFHLFVTTSLLVRILANLNPIKFLKKMYNVQVFAFSTSSSNATIPVTFRSVTQRLGVDKSVASFTVPFGATINMDGTAIMQGVATVFIANIYGVDLGLVEYLTVVVMAVLASIGTAGVPGVGLIMLSMVFAQVGLPLEGIGLILGVDRLMDMIRTAVNVTGDAAASTIVSKSEGKFNVDTFNNPDAGSLTEDDIELHGEELQTEVNKS